jgi:hypothetical protein
VVRKAGSFGGKAINVRGTVDLVPVTAKIAVTEVVHEDEN